MTSEDRPVLILGAGINGAAIARELLLNGVPVCIVDTADVCFGATAYSSRLIHGGLRYLEYGEFDLVRESLQERTRLLRLAPQFVHPLQLFVPVRTRLGGLVTSVRRFLGAGDGTATEASRGLWLVKTGLWLYERFAPDSDLPPSRVHAIGELGVPPFDPQKYYSACSYYDAQISYPERFVVALLRDAQQIAVERKVRFRLATYSRAVLEQDRVTIEQLTPSDQRFEKAGPSSQTSVRPSLIINATGAWVDLTLQNLQVPSPPLMGGTKGSHFITYKRALRDRIGASGIYVEAADGRPFFILPFLHGTLVGTTDLPFKGDPRMAIASDDELAYLLENVNSVLPGVQLTHDDIALHYCGVRPLPHTDQHTPSSITRRHALRENTECSVPFFSVIGGKLTTCRSLAEEVAHTLLPRLGKSADVDSRERTIPGGESYPKTLAALAAEQARLVRLSGLQPDQIQAIWERCGTETETVVTEARHLANADTNDIASIAETNLPRLFVRWVIHHEWVTRLDDLVERRLVLVYERNLSVATLRDLAQLMVEEHCLAVEAVDDEVAACAARLRTHFGRTI